MPQEFRYEWEAGHEEANSKVWKNSKTQPSNVVDDIWTPFDLYGEVRLHDRCRKCSGVY